MDPRGIHYHEDRAARQEHEARMIELAQKNTESARISADAAKSGAEAADKSANATVWIKWMTLATTVATIVNVIIAFSDKPDPVMLSFPRSIPASSVKDSTGASDSVMTDHMTKLRDSVSRSETLDSADRP